MSLRQSSAVMEKSEEGDISLSVPPTDFRRMLSWQLSNVLPAPVSSSRSRVRKEREKRKKERRSAECRRSSGSSEVVEGEESEDGSDEEDGGAEEGFAYLVVNSEGEEECYYSAPESPLDSEDEIEGGRGGVRGGEEEEVGLPQQERKPGARSKKAKKKTRSIIRLAEVEFFGPLCDLVEGSLGVEVGGAEGSDKIDVPCLAELCVRRIHSAKLVKGSAVADDTEDAQHLPFLIHALLGGHRAHRSLVGTQVRWLERILAAWETHSCKTNISQCHSTSHYGSSPMAYCIRPLWNGDSAIAVADPLRGLSIPLHYVSPTGMGINTPLDGLFWELRDVNICLSHVRHVASLTHFANFLYPLFTLRGEGGGGGGGGGGGVKPDCSNATLSPSQTAAIARVNKFLTSRYKTLCRHYEEYLKLWPGYVYWARGQVNMALAAFTSALESLKHVMDKAVVLNEMGRMMVMYGHRYSAPLFFIKSQETNPPVNEFEFFNPTTDMMQLHMMALQASVWDCGLLTVGAARQAVQAWSRVLPLCTGTNWYLPLAAVESRLMVHSTVAVGPQPYSHPPLSPPSPDTRSGRTDEWLNEVIGFVSQHTSAWPILYYHHSLLLAMTASLDTSRQVFLRFCQDFLELIAWNDGVAFPGDPFHVVDNWRLLNPWVTLVNILNEQGLTHAPVLKLKWRTRLLYPMYPYSQTKDVNYLADHCSKPINIRLSDSGYITADLFMDLPPMRAIFLDPYTGSVCFSRSASVHHTYSGPFVNTTHPLIRPDEMAMPWPLRLLEKEVEGEETITVELIMSNGVDLEPEYGGPYWTNHCAMLHWYCGSRHCQLDLRVAIRRELKKVELQYIQDETKEEEEDLMEKVKMGDQDAKVKLKEMKKKKKKKMEILSTMLERGYNVSYNTIGGAGSGGDTLEVPSKYITEKVRIENDKKGGRQWQRRKVRNPHVMEFSLTLTEYFVFSDSTLTLFFSLFPLMDGSNPQYHQAMAVINCSSEESFLKPRVYCVSVASWGFECLFPSNEQSLPYQSRHLPHISHLAVCHKKSKSTASQLLLDDSGDVVFSVDINSDNVPESGRHIKFSMCHRIFNWDRSKGVTNWNMKMCEAISTERDSDNGEDILNVVPVAGCLLIHTNSGLFLLHPGSLEKVELSRPKKKDESKSSESPEEELQYQFRARNTTFTVHSVFNVEAGDREPHRVSGQQGNGEKKEDKEEENKEEELATKESEEEKEKDKEEEEERKEEDKDDKAKIVQRKRELGRLEFGSCCVALTLNSRLLVLHVPHRTEVVNVLVDMVMPGRVTEFYDMRGQGHMVSVTQFPDNFREFPDNFREELYWLSPSGQLRGMLPCLGPGRHSFFSLTLPPRPSNQRSEVVAEEEMGEGDGGDSGGQCVFFNDGQGGICCVQLATD